MHDQLLDGQMQAVSSEPVGFEVERVSSKRPGLRWEHLNPLPGIACSSELFGIGLGGCASLWTIDGGQTSYLNGPEDLKPRCRSVPGLWLPRCLGEAASQLFPEG